MRKFLLAAALIGSVAACGEKQGEGMEEGGEMAPPAAATADSTMGKMADSMGTMADSMGAMADSMKKMADDSSKM